MKDHNSITESEHAQLTSSPISEAKIRTHKCIYMFVEEAAAAHGADPALVQDRMDRRVTVTDSQGTLEIFLRKRVPEDGEYVYKEFDLINSFRLMGKKGPALDTTVSRYLRNMAHYIAREVRQLHDYTPQSPNEQMLYDVPAASQIDPTDADWLATAISSLEPQVYEAVYAYIVLNKSQSQIAREFGINRHMVHRLIIKGLCSLRGENPDLNGH